MRQSAATSTMTPDASVNSGVHDGSVARVTRIAARFIVPKSAGLSITATSASNRAAADGQAAQFAVIVGNRSGSCRPSRR
jgi:hypothetical protein